MKDIEDPRPPPCSARPGDDPAARRVALMVEGAGRSRPRACRLIRSCSPRTRTGDVVGIPTGDDVSQALPAGRDSRGALA